MTDIPFFNRVEVNVACRLESSDTLRISFVVESVKNSTAASAATEMALVMTGTVLQD